jgi:hypothetical protein
MGEEAKPSLLNDHNAQREHLHELQILPHQLLAPLLKI